MNTQNSQLDWCPLYSRWQTSRGGIAINLGRTMDIKTGEITSIRILDVNTEQESTVAWQDWTRWKEEGRIKRVASFARAV